MMQLSPRERELHNQEQNLFRLIQSFKTTTPIIGDQESELFWQLLLNLESKEINERNMNTHPSIDPTFLAIRQMERATTHPLHAHMASWIPLLPAFVREVYAKWKVPQDPHAKDSDVKADAKKLYEVNDNIIYVPGEFDDLFTAKYISLCMSIGIDAPEIYRDSKGLTIGVSFENPIETYTLLLDSALEELQPVMQSIHEALTIESFYAL